MTLKATPLNNAHRALGARMVDFGGWDMPVNYGSQIEEHHAVRGDAGMFDVSHMCVVDIEGPNVRAFLRGLLANKDLDVVPEIKLLRQRLDDGIHSARESAIRAAQDAARQAKDAAIAADRYAHDEPWRVAGAALAVGALVGFLLARR